MSNVHISSHFICLQRLLLTLISKDIPLPFVAFYICIVIKYLHYHVQHSQFRPFHLSPQAAPNKPAFTTPQSVPLHLFSTFVFTFVFQYNYVQRSELRPVHLSLSTGCR